MIRHPNSAPLSVLFIGGTGTISAACVRRAIHEGMQVTVLNRGLNSRDRTVPYRCPSRASLETLETPTRFALR